MFVAVVEVDDTALAVVDACNCPITFIIPAVVETIPVPVDVPGKILPVKLIVPIDVLLSPWDIVDVPGVTLPVILIIPILAFVTPTLKLLPPPDTLPVILIVPLNEFKIAIKDVVCTIAVDDVTLPTKLIIPFELFVTVLALPNKFAAKNTFPIILIVPLFTFSKVFRP